MRSSMGNTRHTYLLLHRAVRNAGDFLIRQRARELLRRFRPDGEFVEGEAWRPLAAQFSRFQLASAAAVIVAGGPGYQSQMYPRTYPLGNPRHLPPVVLLALGSYVSPPTDTEIKRFRFSSRTEEFLRQVVERAGFLGARDCLTDQLLAARGLQPVRMVGDPAWYGDRLDTPMSPPARIQRVAFTPPANAVYWPQAERLFTAMGKRLFAGSTVTIVFHRGVERPWARFARDHGWSCLNIEGGSAGFHVYERQDLHVGYRVHAHLYCLAAGIPTYLVAEDSRGRGVHATLGELGALGISPRARRSLGLTVGFKSARVLRSLSDYAPFLRIADIPDVSEAIGEQVRADADVGFARHEHARTVMRATLKVMQETIEALP